MRYIVISILVSLSMLCSCASANCEDDGDTPAVTETQRRRSEIEVRFDVIDNVPRKKIFAQAKNRDKVFFVVSKVHPEHLNVYEPSGQDTLLLATYPVCLAKNYGPKQRKGDNKTPECSMAQPFYICQIQNSSTWTHDFKDGRGSIPSYGNWFLRLATPGFSGIGIHGSTNNRESIKAGRGSEGCIRLLDEDIIHLKENYVSQGIKVVVLAEGQGPLPFEEKAMLKTGAFKMVEVKDTLPAAADSSLFALNDSLAVPGTVADSAVNANPSVIAGSTGNPQTLSVMPGSTGNPQDPRSEPRVTQAVKGKAQPAIANPSVNANPSVIAGSTGNPKGASPAGKNPSVIAGSTGNPQTPSKAEPEKRFSSENVEIAVQHKVEKNYPDKVTVSGSRQRLRVGGPTGSIYANSAGKAICPSAGAELECLGVEGNYYKVRFNGKELYINKASVK